MRKSKDYSLVLLLLILGIAILVNLPACYTNSYSPLDNYVDTQVKLSQPRHECGYDLCPYKGLREYQWSDSVASYTQCDKFTDAWCIDMLHLKYPDEDYEQLEDRLFNPSKYNHNEKR